MCASPAGSVGPVDQEQMPGTPTRPPLPLFLSIDLLSPIPQFSLSLFSNPLLSLDHSIIYLTLSIPLLSLSFSRSVCSITIPLFLFVIL